MERFVSPFGEEYKKRVKRGRRLALLICAAALLIGSVTALLIARPWEQTAFPTLSSEGARAVLTTPCTVYDGVGDTQRYSDALLYPVGIALKDGRLVVADSLCDRIQILGDDGSVRVGQPGQYGLAYIDSGALVDGYRQNALFMKPTGVAVAPNGDILICDTGNNVIRRMDDTYVITVAGNGLQGYADGREGQARFNAPRGIAVGADGVIYVADTMNHCIRRIDQDGNVSLYAGTPGQAGYRDGAAKQALFYEPCGLYMTPKGDLYVADAANHAVRKISGGAVSTMAGRPGATVAGTGYPQGGYVDGDNASARFNFPRDIAMLPDGSLLVADSLNHAVRLIRDGTTRTLAGGGQAGQFCGSAENLQLSRPEGVCTDGQTLYIADTLGNRVVAVPLTERFLAGRPSREDMLKKTGVSTDTQYAYHGDIRVFVGDQRVDMGRVQAWNTSESVYIPIRPLFEALGAIVTLDEKTHLLTVTIGGQDTVLTLNQDYFIQKGVAVTTTEQIARLFPYTVEWFEEFSVLAFNGG